MLLNKPSTGAHKIHRITFLPETLSHPPVVLWSRDNANCIWRECDRGYRILVITSAHEIKSHTWRGDIRCRGDTSAIWEEGDWFWCPRRGDIPSVPNTHQEKPKMGILCYLKWFSITKWHLFLRNYVKSEEYAWKEIIFSIRNNKGIYNLNSPCYFFETPSRGHHSTQPGVKGLGWLKLTFPESEWL